ncbi:MAG: TlpA disulfide reductase family protein [Methylomonas sp.]|nr:TlpA disulfide reductase family protein [Methylomonas sp.]
MIIRNAIGLLLLALLSASAYWYWQIQTPRPAPEVSFNTIKGQTLALNALKGKPAVVTFWATDCPSCIEEIPHLISLHHRYRQRDLTVIAVAMPYDPPNHVLAMAESRQIPYAVALDPNGELVKAFGDVRLTPTTFLIDGSGNIVLQKVGAFELTEMQRQIERL